MKKKRIKDKIWEFFKFNKIFIFIILFLFFNLPTVLGDVYAIIEDTNILYESDLIKLKPVTPDRFEIINFSDQIDLSEIKLIYTIPHRNKTINETINYQDENIYLISYISFNEYYQVDMYYDNSLIYAIEIKTSMRDDNMDNTMNFYFYISGILIFLILGIVMLIVLNYTHKKIFKINSNKVDKKIRKSFYGFLYNFFRPNKSKTLLFLIILISMLLLIISESEFIILFYVPIAVLFFILSENIKLSATTSNIISVIGGLIFYYVVCCLIITYVRYLKGKIKK